MSEFTVTYDSCIEAARLASSRGDRLGAEQALIAAIAAAGTPGSEPLLAAALVKLGELKRDVGSLAEAEEMFGRAVEINESVDRDQGTSLAAALTNLAGIRAVRGAPEDAEKYLTRALALTETRLGREHPDLVVLLNDLSRLYLKRSAYALAEPLLHRLHAIKRQKGEDHAEVATVLASLATVRQALGDHDAAEQLWRRVLAIRERTLAPNHFAIATAVENLAETCSARGKVSEALRLFHRALAMREMTLGLAHPSLRTLRERIADLQLQGADEFSGEEVVAFAAPPVAVRIPPAATYPTVEIPAPAPVAHITAPEPRPERAEPDSAVADYELRMQALRDFAAVHAAQAVPARQPATPPGPVQAIAMPSAVASAASAAAPSMTPMVYAQPNAAELEVPAWDQVAPGAATGGATRSAQPMSFILPAPSDVRSGDEQDDDENFEFAQTRMERMSGSLGGLFRQRQIQVAAAGAIAIALVVVAAALASQPRDGSDDSTLERGIPAQQYVAGGAAALGDSMRALGLDSTASSPEPATAEREAIVPAPSTERARAEPSRGDRTPARSASTPTPVPEAVAPRMPDAPRALSGISTAQLDSAMRAAAPGRVSVSAPIVKPAFQANIGAVDYTDRAANKPPLVIGAVPRIPYPESLRVDGRETAAEVLVEFAVDTLGVPVMSTLRIVRTDHELLSQAVFNVIPAMRFVPGTASGKKAVAKVQIPFAFAIGKR